MAREKKPVNVRFDNKFVEWLDIRAKAERITRTALLEKIGWSYLRSHFSEDQQLLESINKIFEKDKNGEMAGQQ